MFAKLHRGERRSAATAEAMAEVLAAAAPEVAARRWWPRSRPTGPCSGHQPGTPLSQLIEQGNRWTTPSPRRPRPRRLHEAPGAALGDLPRRRPRRRGAGHAPGGRPRRTAPSGDRRTDRRAARRGRGRPRSTVASVVVHGDLKADHLLVDGDRLSLLDFDSCVGRAGARSGQAPGRSALLVRPPADPGWRRPSGRSSVDTKGDPTVPDRARRYEALFLARAAARDCRPGTTTGRRADIGPDRGRRRPPPGAGRMSTGALEWVRSDASGRPRWPRCRRSPVSSGLLDVDAVAVGSARLARRGGALTARWCGPSWPDHLRAGTASSGRLPAGGGRAGGPGASDARGGGDHHHRHPPPTRRRRPRNGRTGRGRRRQRRWPTASPRRSPTRWPPARSSPSATGPGALRPPLRPRAGPADGDRTVLFGKVYASGMATVAERLSELHRCGASTAASRSPPLWTRCPSSAWWCNPRPEVRAWAVGSSTPALAHEPSAGRRGGRSGKGRSAPVRRARRAGSGAGRRAGGPAGRVGWRPWPTRRWPSGWTPSSTTCSGSPAVAGTPVPSHGSFRADHVVLKGRASSSSISTVRVERAARDAGNLLAYLRWRALRHPHVSEAVTEVDRASCPATPMSPAGRRALCHLRGRIGDQDRGAAVPPAGRRGVVRRSGADGGGRPPPPGT